MKSFKIIYRYILGGLMVCAGIIGSAPDIYATTPHLPSADISETQSANDLSDHERLAKSLIETVQKLLENGDAQTREQLLRQLQKDNQSHGKTKAEKPAKKKNASPTYNSAPDNERKQLRNGNPRPYLGESIQSDPLNIIVPEIGIPTESSELNEGEEEFYDYDEYYSEEDTSDETGNFSKELSEDEIRTVFPFLNPVDNSDDNETSGNYIWVPDSLYTRVIDLLEGRSVASVPSSIPSFQADPENEKVIFRGDTIPMVIRDRKIGRYDRKLYNYLSYPKGMWGASLTASYGELSTESLEMLSLLSDVTLKGHIFSIKPAISYFIKNNLSIGLRLSYTEGKAGIDSFKVDIDEDINFSLSDIGYHSEQYQAGLTITRYYGLSRRNRIQLTNEVELGFSSGNSDFRRPYSGKPKNTHTTTMKASLTFSPGVSVQVMRNVSFDLSFGAFGLYISRDRTSVDDIYQGSRTSSGANFRFNIFNINFGIGVHI